MSWRSSSAPFPIHGCQFTSLDPAAAPAAGADLQRSTRSGPRWTDSTQPGQRGRAHWQAVCSRLGRVLGEAAAAAGRTDTFLGERYRRIVKRRGKLKALVAVARSILVIIWNLLTHPTARYQDLGSGYHTSRTDTGKKVRNHIRQLEALGFAVTLTQAA
jgi:transposase